MVIDLLTRESLIEGLEKIFEEDFEKVDKGLISYMQQEELDEELSFEFLRANVAIEWEKVLKQKWIFKGYHITSRSVSENIREQDIYNLPDTLKNDTALRAFLNKNGIEFDFSTNQFILKGRSISFDDSRISRIMVKIRAHSEICFFLRFTDSNYSCIDEFPEIVNDIAGVCGEGLKIKWREQNYKPFVLEFDISFEDLYFEEHTMIAAKNEFISKMGIFEKEFVEYESEFNETYKVRCLILMLKMYMLHKLYDSNDERFNLEKVEYFNWGNFLDELHGVVKLGRNIIKDQIINVWNFEEFVHKYQMK